MKNNECFRTSYISALIIKQNLKRMQSCYTALGSIFIALWWEIITVCFHITTSSMISDRSRNCCQNGKFELFCFTNCRSNSRCHQRIGWGHYIHTSERTTRRWFGKFRVGDFSLEDREGCGRLSEVDDDKLKRMADANPRTSTTEIGEEQLTQTYNVTSRKVKR